MRRLERSGDYRALAHAYARVGQTREAYDIMLGCLTDECDAAKKRLSSDTAAMAVGGQERFKEAGGCMECLGVGYVYITRWKHVPCGSCDGAMVLERVLLARTDEEEELVWRLREAVAMAEKEIKAWTPGIERNDLVMYFNEKARAKFARNCKDAGIKVPYYTCGIVEWLQLGHRAGIKVITGPHEGMFFYTGYANIRHVNGWKKIMEKEGVVARLAVYTPKRGDYVWCRGHYGKVLRTPCLKGSTTLAVRLQTPGKLYYTLPAHECRKADAPKTNLLEEMA